MLGDHILRHLLNTLLSFIKHLDNKISTHKIIVFIMVNKYFSRKKKCIKIIFFTKITVNIEIYIFNKSLSTIIPQVYVLAL